MMNIIYNLLWQHTVSLAVATRQGGGIYHKNISQKPEKIFDVDKNIYSPGPPEFTEELRMRQETDGVLLESFLIYEPEHQATWFKAGWSSLIGQ